MIDSSTERRKQSIETLIEQEYVIARSAENESSADKIKQLLISAQYILVLTHPDPDEDAIGSCLTIINAFGKEKRVEVPLLSHANFPIEDFNGYETLGYDSDQVLKQFSLSKKQKVIITVDIGDLNRIPYFDEIKKLGIPIVNIDHHPQSGDNESSISVNLVDPKFESTTEILFWLLKRWNKEIDPSTATSLLLGVFGDTEYYQDISLPKRINLLAYYLKTLGADENTVITNVQRSRSVEELNILGYALQKVVRERNYAYVILLKDEYQNLIKNFKRPFEKAVIVNMLRSIEDIDFAFVMIEQDTNKISCSLKARTNKVDMSSIAHKFGGGGHLTSAAFRTQGEMNDVFSSLRSFLNS